MARSSYIYVLYDAWSNVVGAFTVLHELMTYVERNPTAGVLYERWRDGQPDAGVTAVKL